MWPSKLEMLNNDIFHFIYNARKAAILANMLGMESRKKLMEEFQLSIAVFEFLITINVSEQ